VPGRTRAVLTLGPLTAAPTDAVEESVLALMRARMALTAGQYVAHELETGREPSRTGLDEAVATAQAEGRPVDPELLDGERRGLRLEQALAEARRQPGELPFLTREYASARRT
jgi:hypothetical protein